MISEQLLNLIFAKGAIILVKFFAFTLLGLHLIFSIILVKQTKMMTKAIEVRISPLIYLISVIHLIASIVVFIWLVFFTSLKF